MKYLVVVILLFLGPATVFGQSLNGFNLKGALIPVDEIRRGGPPRDGIPSIDRPKFISAAEALKKYPQDDRAIVVELKKSKRVYPISILNWHEIVNDVLEGQALLVTFCPLCGTGIVFDAKIGGARSTFGVSGLLYQSDVLMYDRETNSLWSQLLNKAVTGKRKGMELKVVNSQHVDLHDYLKSNKDAQVLSRKTGEVRDYDRSPYGDYNTSRRLYFPINHKDGTFHPKEWSLLMKYDTKVKIIALKSLPNKGGKKAISFGKKSFELIYDKKGKKFVCPKARGLSCMTGFWFALRTFYPSAEIYKN